MANMREIRNRMKSIQDTMKITKAMYVVSSSKLKKAQKQYDRTKPYYKALSNTMADIMEHIEPEVTHKYINDKPPVSESKVIDFSLLLQLIKVLQVLIITML